MIVGNPIVPDSAGLNFDVIRCSDETMLPATAKENTFAVFTDIEITDWAFASKNPYLTDMDLIEGAVWFYTSSTSTRAFNAITENTLYVYPNQAYQYINGQWVSVSIKIYQNGWKGFELIFYQDGVFNTEIFGNASHNGTIQSDGSLRLYRYGYLKSTTLVDITPYSTLQYDIVTSNYGRPDLRVVNSSGTVIASTGQVQGVQTISLDVSEINEPVLVDMYVYGNSNSDNTYINNVKFIS